MQNSSVFPVLILYQLLKYSKAKNSDFPDHFKIKEYQIPKLTINLSVDTLLELSEHIFRCEDLYNYNVEERHLWIVIVENRWNFHCNIGANGCPFYLSVYFIQQVITSLHLYPRKFSSYISSENSGNTCGAGD